MAAPPRGRPVMITMGAVWRFQVEAPLPRPQKLSISITVAWTVVALVRFIIAVLYFNDCPQQANIPKYLLVQGLICPFLILLSNPPCMTGAPEHPKGLKACVICLTCTFIFIWILAGDIWVFSVYQPNYDPAAADGLYCNKTLYTFAFWNAVWETLVIVITVAGVCKGLMCGVMMTPNPDNNDFYRNV